MTCYSKNLVSCLLIFVGVTVAGTGMDLARCTAPVLDSCSREASVRDDEVRDAYRGTSCTSSNFGIGR